MEHNEKQLELFDTTDANGVDTHVAPKLPHVDKGFKARFIDPKNQTNLGGSWLNLGNHVLILGFISCIVFVIMASY
tara:strand:- start:3194 stop:3421 length:228 start_codon:yes stop_codon:yes gene_type:complete